MDKSFEKQEDTTKEYRDLFSNSITTCGVFFDEQFNMVQLIGNTFKYFLKNSVTKGSPVFEALLPSLSKPLKIMLESNKVDKSTINKNFILVDELGLQVDFEVHTLKREKENIFLLTIKESVVNKKKNDLVQGKTELALKTEIAKLKEEIRLITSQLEMSNQELASSNEKFMHSKKKLQSANEELYVLNSEVQGKNEELENLNTDIRNLLITTDIGAIFLDNDLNIRKFTPAVKEHFNLLPSDIGRGISDLTGNFVENVDFNRITKNVLKTEKVIEIELVGKSGVSYLLKALPYYKHDDELEGVILTFVNVDQLKKTEQQLRRSEDNFESLVKSNPSVVARVSTDFLVEYVNPAVFEELGIKSERLTNKHIKNFKLDEANYELLEFNIKNVFVTGKDDKFLIKKKVGKNEKFFQVSLTLESNTKRPQIICVFVNVTSNIQHEKELRKIVEELERTNSRLEEFAYVATHDLRSPVVNLRELMNYYDPTSSDAEENEIIIDNVRKSISILYTTLNDLIEIITLTKGVNVKKQVVDVDQIVASIKESLKSDINKNKAIIDVNVDTRTKLKYVPSHVSSILYNLISNSIRYRHPKRLPKVQITTKIEQEYYVIMVADNGIGIDLKKHKDKIFKLFTLLHESGEGKGMGLYILKSMVENLGGKIEVESKLGKGTTFIVYLKRN